MKNLKLFSALAAMGLAVSANADVITAFDGGDYNAASAVPEMWSCAAGTLSLGSVAEGDNCINFALGNSNARSYKCVWGTDGYAAVDEKKTGTEYYVSFDFNVTAGNDLGITVYGKSFFTGADTIIGNAKSGQAITYITFQEHTYTESEATYVTFAQRNSQIVLATGEQYSTNAQWGGGNNETNQNNWLFKLTEQAPQTTVAEYGSAYAVATPIFSINDDPNNTIQLTNNTWYSFVAKVDTATRVVNYSIVTKSENPESITSGTYDVPTGVEILPSGLYGLAGRYWSNFMYDNIKVGKWTDAVVANKPTIQLYKIEDETFIYQLSCQDGETIHWSLSEGGDSDNGTSGELSYSDVVEELNVIGITASCTLTAYTTNGSAQSDEVSVDVVCDPIKLPVPTATISSVDNGFGKTYTINIDMTDVPATLFPQDVQYRYWYYVNGEVVKSNEKEEVGGSNNTTITVDQKGTLELKAVLAGYVESDVVTIENDIEYEISKVLDFQNMTTAQIEALGLIQKEGGVRDYWTTFGAGYVAVVTDGETTSKTFIRDYDPEQPYQILSSTLADSVSATRYFDNLVLWHGESTVNGYLIPHIGLVTALSKGDDEKGSAISNATLCLYGYTDDDYMIVYKLGGYSRNIADFAGASGYNGKYEFMGSSLEECAEKFEDANIDIFYDSSEILPATSKFDLYRYDTALAAIKILTRKSTAISDVQAERVEDANAPIYNLQGVKVSKDNLQKNTIYIQNGKTFMFVK